MRGCATGFPRSGILLIVTKKQEHKDTQIYVENPKWEKLGVEEKKINYVKN